MLHPPIPQTPILCVATANVDSHDHNVVVEFGGQSDDQHPGGESPGTDNLVTFITSREISAGEKEQNIYFRQCMRACV